MNSPDRRAACSVITANHLPRARVLVESLHRHTPALPVFVLVVDDVAGRFEPEGEDFTVVSYEALAVPHSQFLRFAYPAQGVCSTAKPYLLRYLLRQGYAELLYLDADLFVVGDLSPLFDRLAGYSVLLTPHLTEPVPNGARAEEEPLHAGCFNAGFIGVHAGPSADRFLSWWADRVYPTAREFVWEADGYDQRWLDLAPGLVDGLHVVRDPGCNVAHWNLPTRHVTVQECATESLRIEVNGQPGYFFHFSGFDPHDRQRLSKNAPQVRVDDLGAVSAIVEQYRAHILAAEYDVCREWSYTRDYFDDGARIAPAARRLYRHLGPAAHAFGDPFQTAGSGSFFGWLSEPDPADSGPRTHATVSRFWHAIYRQRPDLQRAFPHLFGADRQAYLAWAHDVGAPYGRLRPDPLTEGSLVAVSDFARALPAELPLLPESVLSLESMRAAVETSTEWAERLLSDVTVRATLIAAQQQEMEVLRSECASRLDVVAEQEAALAALRSTVTERTAWAEGLLVEAERRGAVIAEQEAALASLREVVAERTAWAEGLLAEAERRAVVIARQQAALNALQHAHQ